MGKNKKHMFSEEEQMLLFDEYQKTKDENIRNVIVEKNLGLAVNYVAKYFKNAPMEFEDMVQIATIGLVKAVEHFDASLGFKFSTFAGKSMKNELIKAMKSESIDMSLISLEEPVSSGMDDRSEETTLGAFLADESESYIARDLETKNLLQRIYSWVLANCDPKEIVIFEAFLGLGGLRPQRGADIAEQLGISTQRVFKIRQELRRKLRNKFSSDLEFLRNPQELL